MSDVHEIASEDGTRIAVWRSGSGPPLLLVHGTTADHTRWALVRPLLEAHFTVFALDRRGRGGSGDTLPYSIEREGEDVAAVADWIGEPVALLGHSYGALCALEGALLTRSIHRLALYEPPIPIGLEVVPVDTRERVSALLDAGELEEALVVFFREVVEVPEEQLDVLRAHPAWPARVAAAHTLSREMDVEATYRLDFERLRRLQTPTTLLLGSESPAALTEPTHRVHEVLPESVIVVMEGQQHVAMDTIPEEFVRLIVTAALPRAGEGDG